ncbi:MAG: hypothetical protein QW175_07715, partial [Candidatus Bathyarchaeia archaeon]
MRVLKKALNILLVVAITLHYASTLISGIALGNSPADFVIRSYYARSSADTSNIYPGSRRVYLKIEAEYQNSASSATMVFGWLKTPEGISFSSGSDVSSPAKFNGSVVREVTFGMVITFEYLLDFFRGLSPGTYYLTLNITYVKGSIPSYDLHPNEIRIDVSHYPDISLRVIDAYFSPSPYPGS